MGKMKDIATMLAEYKDALYKHGSCHEVTQDLLTELFDLNCEFVVDEVLAIEYQHMDEFYHEFG